MKPLDLTGLRVGMLTAIKRDSENTKDGKAKWICRCDCGNIKSIACSTLRKGKIKSCGCITNKILSESRLKKDDLIGQRFGRLVVVKFSHRNKNGSYFNCICDCGREIITTRNRLRFGQVKSCGCFQKEKASLLRKSHGDTNKRLYSIYKTMKARCYYKKAISYHNYGGRGITICDEWLNDYSAFKEWAMANGYRDDLTIDRIDNNKGYSPDNCKWSTMKEQAQNRRPRRVGIGLS